MGGEAVTRRELIDYCLTYPDAYEDYPFGAFDGAPDFWAVMRHKGNKKSFAFIYERAGLCINLKCEPLCADFLRRAYPGVTPAYHMNKVHWNTVYPNAVPEDALRQMIDNSHQLTLPKGKRK